jgi:hypothetical protein
MTPSVLPAQAAQSSTLSQSSTNDPRTQSYPHGSVSIRERWWLVRRFSLDNMALYVRPYREDSEIASKIRGGSPELTRLSSVSGARSAVSFNGSGDRKRTAAPDYPSVNREAFVANSASFLSSRIIGHGELYDVVANAGYLAN